MQLTSTIENYIGVTILKFIGIVTLALMGLMLFIILVSELGDVGQGDYGTWQALAYTFMILPERLFQVFPIAGLLGSLIALGGLASRSELVVMRSSGISRARIFWAVLKVALLLMLIVTILGEFIAPKLITKAEHYKAVLESGGQALQTERGLWIRDGNDFIHVSDADKKHGLSDIIMYRFDNAHHLLSASHAKSATGGNGHWILHDIDVSQFHGQTQTTLKHMDKEHWSIVMPSLNMLSPILDPDEMSLADLHAQIEYRDSHGLNAASYQLYFWKQLFSPLTVAIMILLALPFVFGPLRTANMGLRIVMGILIGFGFYLVNQFFGQLGIYYQIPPIWGALIPILLFSLIGVWMLIRSP